MGRKKKFLFKEPKMLASRIEKSDFEKISFLLENNNISVQEFINTIVRQYISGNINLSGSEM
jgi:hypothetical protein